MGERSVGTLERLGIACLLLLPGALLVFFSFNAGGFFPGTPALVAVVLLLVLVARVLVAPRPFAGLSPALGVAVGALGLFAAWSLVSAAWSGSSWRAMVEFDRALLYLLALLLFGLLPRDAGRVRWMVRGLALAIVVVCSVALITRLAPDVWPIAPNLGSGRLSYPLTYWNSLGLLAAVGTILCFHLTCSRSEPRPLRVAGAGAIPILATTVLFTFSRGSVLTGMIGLAVYVAFGRPRALLSGLLASFPPAAAAVALAYGADAVAEGRLAAGAELSQAHGLALTIGLCVIGAVWLRWLLLPLDPRLDRLLPALRARYAVILALVAGAAVTYLLAAVNLGGYVSDQYDRFTDSDSEIGRRADPRTRFTDPGNNGRLNLWRVAVDDGFEPAKLDGQGAGTYELIWNRNRSEEDASLTVKDAHSFYLESLGELGLVGFLLALTFVLAILYGFAARLSGPNRTLYAVLLAVGLVWALHAGVDWDWEMPAVTLWLFALAGAALAAPARTADPPAGPPVAMRAALAAALLLVGIVPALVTVSQGRLDSAVRAFIDRGDCATAIDRAAEASSVLAARPEPYRLQGYCEARLGQTETAVESMRKALERDPDNWQYHYSLAVAQAAAGIDPMPAAMEARRLDPEGKATADLIERFPSLEPQALRREAAPLLREPVF